jgi:hypothetical protein
MGASDVTKRLTEERDVLPETPGFLPPESFISHQIFKFMMSDLWIE